MNKWNSYAFIHHILSNKCHTRVPTLSKKCMYQIVMSCDQNLRESRVNMISCLRICAKCEFHEFQFSPFIMVVCGKTSQCEHDFT